MENFGYCGSRGKNKNNFRLIVLLSLPSCRQRIMLFALLVHSKSCLQKFSPRWAPHLRRLLRDHATRDTDNSEVQRVSEPENLIVVSFPEG